MKKRMLCFLPALLMALLCGCAEDAPVTEPSETATVPAFTPGETLDTSDLRGTLPEDELADCIEQAKQAARQVPEYTGSPLIPADPDRQIYISLGEEDSDFYEDGWFFGRGFYILSLQPYSIDQIRVNIPMKTYYTVNINDVTENFRSIAVDPSEDQNGIEEYEYLCLQGVDWRWLAQERENVQAAYDLFGENPFSASYQVCDYMDNAYEKLLADYRAEFEVASPEDLPQFYVYNVSIQFREVTVSEDGIPIMGKKEFVDETVETMEITIGEEMYTVDFGQWRFHRQFPAEIEESFDNTRLKQINCLSIESDGTPYEGDIIRVMQALDFEAVEALTVTGVHQLGGKPVQILGGKVSFMDSAQNVTQEFYWELGQPLRVDAGSHVSIELYLKDPSFAQYSISKTTYLIMDYEIGGKAYGMTLPCVLTRGNPSVWEAYLMAFAGYDMGEYYTCYAPSLTAYWLPDLPEEWRQ